MANIATCPQCAKQLGLPTSIAITDQAECPECQAVFRLSETVQISLPVARVVDRTEHQAAAANLPNNGSLSEAELAPDDNSPAALAANAPPRRNWEERLKKALARDVSEDASAPSTQAAGNALTAVSRTPEVSGTTAADSKPSSTIEPELDRRTSAVRDTSRAQVNPAAPTYLSAAATTEPAAQRTENRSKTLADFAAAVDIASVDIHATPAQHSELKNVADTVSVTSGPTAVGKLSQKVAFVEEVEAAITEHAESVLPSIPRKTSALPLQKIGVDDANTTCQLASSGVVHPNDPDDPNAKRGQSTSALSLQKIGVDDANSTCQLASSGVVHPNDPDDPNAKSGQSTSVGSRFPKFAALVVGPVLGSLLGLYGLLWLQGAEADYVGLSRVVPDSMLPADWSGPSADSTFANSSRSEEVLKEAVSFSLLPAHQEMPHSQRSTVPMKRDASVLPASAAQRVAPTGSIASHSTPIESITTASTVTETKARITADQFRVLVDNAAAALPDFFVGDLSMPQSIHNKGQAYMSLCRLAEHFDFAQQPGLTLAAQAKARQARQLYRSATSQANFREELSHIAARWWAYQQRPSLGIFLAGQVQVAQPEGAGSICWIMLSEHSNIGAIPVLLNHQRYQTGDRIGVVGSLISSPSSSLAGFGAGAKQRVAAHYDYLLDSGR